MTGKPQCPVNDAHCDLITMLKAWSPTSLMWKMAVTTSLLGFRKTQENNLV